MNTKLPIFKSKDLILKTINENPVTIINAETGAGKSTQVPQYLLDEGYTILVTQPRVLSVRTVSERVAEEYGSVLGGTVGYRTSHEQCDSVNTQCLFATDGLALIREILNQNKCDVLIIDEVHEWNINIEVLIAWCKKEIKQGADFKLVLMSATLELEKLSSFFDNAPVIRVPGRMFSVETQRPSHTYPPNQVLYGRIPGYLLNMKEDIVHLVEQEKNVLVFLQGKSEIEILGELLSKERCPMKILPLHAQLAKDEQQKCFDRYDIPKVVLATNIAQTSVTINDINAVVDSGLEKRVEVVDHVEGLHSGVISRADENQRKGRAGRVCPGVYISHRPDVPYDLFPTPQILRSILDQVVLRLIMVGYDAEELNFLHQPDRDAIRNAKVILKTLGCLNDNGTITDIGNRVAKMPVSVRSGRMLFESSRLGVLNEMVSIISILESGSLLNTQKGKNGKGYIYPWHALISAESKSDLIAQFNALKIADSIVSRQGSGDEAYKLLMEKGVNVKIYLKVKEMIKKVNDALSTELDLQESISDTREKRHRILLSIVAGFVDQVWKNGENGKQFRYIHNDSVVYNNDLVVGMPFNISGRGRSGKNYFVNLLRFVTTVTPSMLVTVAPHLVKKSYDALYSRGNSIYGVETLCFNGLEISKTVGIVTDSDAIRFFFENEISKLAKVLPDYSPNSELKLQVEILEGVTHSNIRQKFNEIHLKIKRYSKRMVSEH